MKLAEALIRRKELRDSIFELQNQISTETIILEDEEPTQDNAALIAQVVTAHNDVEYLTRCINETNNAEEVYDGTTIMDCIARRDALDSLVNFYDNLLRYKTRYGTRVQSTDLRQKSTLDFAALKGARESAVQEKKQLDLDIQAANWQVELYSL